MDASCRLLSLTPLSGGEEGVSTEGFRKPIFRDERLRLFRELDDQCGRVVDDKTSIKLSRYMSLRFTPRFPPSVRI